MKKQEGWVKYADQARGYGYIVSTEAKDATETVLFEEDDTSSEFDDLVPGATVEYEVEDANPKAQAKNIRIKRA